MTESGAHERTIKVLLADDSCSFETRWSSEATTAPHPEPEQEGI